eukprot:scaffold107804_cov19-Prasinocladus_malaysianus.AAC.3
MPLGDQKSCTFAWRQGATRPEISASSSQGELTMGGHWAKVGAKDFTFSVFARARVGWIGFCTAPNKIGGQPNTAGR